MNEDVLVEHVLTTCEEDPDTLVDLTWKGKVHKRLQDGIIHSADVSPDPPGTVGTPGVYSARRTVSRDRAAYEAKRLAEAAQTSGNNATPIISNGFPIGQAQMDAEMSKNWMQALEKYQGGVATTPTAPVAAPAAAPAPRTCTRSLPGHPVTINADEKKCWKCDNDSF